MEIRGGHGVPTLLKLTVDSITTAYLHVFSCGLILQGELAGTEIG